MCETIHCFEKAGLGKAPFHYIGMENQNIQYGERVIGNVGGCNLTTKPGGTCAYCGTYIVNMFNVVSADGKYFHVGCECIKKTDDSGLIQLLKNDQKKMAKQRKINKLNARIAAAKEKLPVVRGQLSSQPHPSPYFAEQGKTLLDYVNWCFENLHNEKACSIIEGIKS